MIRRPGETYDAANGPAIYRDKIWKKPAGPPLKLTFAQADSIPDYIRIDQPQLFRQGDLALSIAPGYLERNQLVFLRLIKDALPERPLYLSGGEDLGLPLQPYLLTQGFARKVVDHRLTDTAETPQIAGQFVDLPRTKALWDTVYRGPEVLMKEGDWVDRPSFGIPYTYGYTGLVLAELLSREGDTRSADAVVQRVRGIAKAARIEEYLGLGDGRS